MREGTNMKSSVIFKPCELERLNARLKGDKSDKHGLYAGRVKPKIKEIMEWWDRKAELRRLIK